MERPWRLAFAGGGTGGHLVPGLHLLAHRRAAQPEAEVAPLLWLTAGRAIEERVLAPAEKRLGLTILRRSMGLEREGGGAPSALSSLLRVPRAVARARAALREQQSEALLALGGLSSVPAILAARSLGLPTALLEVNAVPGKATRRFGPLCTRVLHAFPSSLPTGAPRGERHLISGPPLTPELSSAPGPALRARVCRELGLDPRRRLLLVVGGSQGARALNRFVAEHGALLIDAGAALIHQAGPGRLGDTLDAHALANASGAYHAAEYFDPLLPLLQSADLVLCRGGASTLWELAAVGVPAWIVPYPHHKDRHQEHNAARLGAGARVVPEERLDQSLARELCHWLAPELSRQREQRAQSLRASVPRDGAQRIWETLARLCARPLPPAPAGLDLGLSAGEFEPGSEPDWLRPALPRRVHFLGLGGAGVSGAARLLAARGHRLSGHDPRPSPLLAGLEAQGIAIEVGPSRPESLPADAQLVVRSAAVPDQDPQVLAARERQVPVLKYAQILRHLAAPARTLAVAGTHGKTSSAWLLHHTLAALTSGSGCLIGGRCRRLDTNAVPPGPEGWFALEACEFDRSFLELDPRAALITNVEAEHLDCFGDFAGVVRAFEQFASRLAPEGLLVLGREVPESIERAARCAVWRLGRELELVSLGQERGRYRFDLSGPGFRLQSVRLEVIGRFQMENAALALALALGATRAGSAAGQNTAGELERARAGIALYPGAARRLEPWGRYGEIELLHDYAHHPTELRVTLEALREAFPDRPLCVLFQPHQAGRTARFLDDFAAALRLADRSVVADVYGARAHSDSGHGQRGPGELSRELVAAARSLGADARYGGPPRAAAELFAHALPPRAAAVVLGAGDIEEVKHDLDRELALRPSVARTPEP
jgi:UDP-N-acetylmuramate--alanine ligase